MTKEEKLEALEDIKIDCFNCDAEGQMYYCYNCGEVFCADCLIITYEEVLCESCYSYL